VRGEGSSGGEEAQEQRRNKGEVGTLNPVDGGGGIGVDARHRGTVVGQGFALVDEEAEAVPLTIASTETWIVKKWWALWAVDWH
jgi:hypothetical protein